MTKKDENPYWSEEATAEEKYHTPPGTFTKPAAQVVKILQQILIVFKNGPDFRNIFDRFMREQINRQYCITFYIIKTNQSQSVFGETQRHNPDTAAVNNNVINHKTAV